MDAEGARPGAQAPLRSDPSGELRRSLRRVIAEGEELETRLAMIEAAGFTAPLESLERWRTRCVAVVQSGFEQEAVAEIGRAASTAPVTGAAKTDRPSRRVKNALELLESLESTLGKRGGRGRRRASGAEHSAVRS